MTLTMDSNSSAPPPGDPLDAGAPAAGAPRGRIRWEGEIGSLFWLSVKNFVLTVLTLSIYRFWGKTAVRRYVWSNLTIDGDPLEYTGTGGELFRSFLVVAFAVILPFLLLSGIVNYLAVIGTLPPGSEQAVSVVFAPIVAVLLAYARFTGLRYRLSRTQWRGVAFGLDGAPGPYVKSFVGRWLLNTACLGLLTPQTLVRVERHRLGRIAFGSATARYDADPAQAPYLPFLAAWLVSMVFMIIAGIVVWALVRDMMAADDIGKPGAQGALLLGIGKLYGILIVGGLVVRVVAYWYEASMMRYMARSLSLGGCGMRTDISFGRLFRLRAWNFLIVVATGGLATAVAWHRELRYLDMHTRIGPVEALAAAAQSGRARPTRGEGLLDAFDAGLA